MPQRKQLQWAQLRVGVMVTVALLLFAVGVFFISGSVGFLTTKYMLKTYMSGASGVREGAQVRLAGIPIGNVTVVKLSPYRDPNRVVEVDMKIAKKYQGRIRSDSVVTVDTAGLLGEAFLDISPGNESKPVVPPGGELRLQDTPDIKDVMQNADDVITNLRAITNRLGDISNQISSGQGTIGKLIYDPSMYNRMDRAVNQVSSLVDQVQSGNGSLGKLVADPTLYNQLLATVNKANGLMDNLQHGGGTVPRLLNDPSLYNNINSTVKKADAAIDKLNTSTGTLGKLINDPSLYKKVNDTFGHLDSVVGRMDRGQGSLGLLSTNDKLYNSLSESARSLSQFLKEFQQNPKKYLTVHVKIF
jgi:phospholipid/cholesterol/gamma-HCH transport system substrate-binding protein